MGLVKGLTANPEKLVDTIVNLVTEIVTVLIQHLPELIEAGVEIIIALAVGLVKAIPEIIKDLPQIISAMMNAFKSADWGGLGSSIIQGIAQGLKALGGALVDTLKNIGLDALNGFKSLFGIHSPSTVFAEMGGHMVQGLINGLNDGKENVNNTLGNLIDDTSLNATIKVGSQNLAINSGIDSGANVRNTNAASTQQQGDTYSYNFASGAITIQAQDHNDVAKWFNSIGNKAVVSNNS